MSTWLVWGILTGIFILGIYIVDRIKKKGDENPSATWMQKHVFLIGFVSIIIPIAVGVILVNTMHETTNATRNRSVHRVASGAPTRPIIPEPPKPEPILKVVISDGSQSTNIATLNKCESNEITIIRHGLVQCAVHPSPAIRAWMADVRVHEKRAMEEFIHYHVKKETQDKLQKYKLNPTVKNKSRPLEQGFGWWLNQESPTPPSKSKTTDKTVVGQKPLKDRYSALFYFLALVLGVLGTYYWDYAEQKSKGVAVQFQPHLIVMSFIIAAMVYYSIQQGLEKEADKLSFRGVVFAFNNGFMWQTVLTKYRRGRDEQAAQVAEVEKPIA